MTRVEFTKREVGTLLRAIKTLQANLCATSVEGNWKASELAMALSEGDVLANKITRQYIAQEVAS